MEAYKLFRLRKDGSISPLFINKTQRVQVGEWLQAEQHRTKGFAFRPGWHCVPSTDSAPHLGKQGRVWARVEIENVTTYERPASQGGRWFTAERLRVVEVLR
jgi:hypothetical protein